MHTQNQSNFTRGAQIFAHKVRMFKQSIINSCLVGATLIEEKSSANILKKECKASSIKFAGLPLVKGSERKHILITGTTGTGKTNMLNELLPQIRSQGKKAVIVDLTGSFISRFYDSKCDKILNPFMPNTEHWLLWNDCHKSVDFDDIASSFSNCNLKGDDFFAKNAELVLSAGLQLFQDSKDIKQLVQAVLYSNNKQFTSKFKNSPVAGIISSDSPETSASIQATLGKNISVLQHLKNGGKFSIKRWIENTLKQGWLFLTASPNERATLQPLISAWISIAVKALMARSPEDYHADMWFIIDELAALRQIPILPTALAESRKYGGCFVAGIQNTHQLEGIYGTKMGAAMLDLFNSKFVFRVSDQQTAYRASMLLGEQETIETQESMSYGSNNVRDGVNMNNIERQRLLVIPSEIMHLPDLTCYVKLAGEYPITKLRMQLQI